MIEVSKSPIIPEFAMYEDGLEKSEIDELQSRFSSGHRISKDPFRHFTDILTDYIGSGEWKNHSNSFLAMCAKASFLRGLYGYNQIIAKGCKFVTCKGYAAAAYCKQSLDPRWLNNLRNYINQAWQQKDYIGFAELSGQLAKVLAELGYTEHARETAQESIDKVTKITAKDERIRTKVQAALLRSRIIMAYIDTTAGQRDEAFVRLDHAEETAQHLNHELALADIQYYRAVALEEAQEYDRSFNLVTSALRKYVQMGYLEGVANARNIKGLIFMDKGQAQDARDEFEELLVIQQQLHNQVGLAKSLINVGEIDRILGQIDQMETYNLRALEISQEAEYMRGIAVSKVNLGDVAVRRGDINTAISYYQESKELAECSGMKDLLQLIIFLEADAEFLLNDYDRAIELYRKAAVFGKESAYPISSFLGTISELVTDWTAMKKPRDEVLEEVKQAFVNKEQWLESNNANLMRDARQKIADDPTIESDHCIFYDREKNFDCRVDRSSLVKECTANLFWKGGLCPYFIQFMTRLYD